MSKPIIVIVLAALAAGATPQAAAAETHPFSVRDMVAMERLGDPAPSPDGRWVVFTRRTWDEAANKVTTNLWLTALDGGGVRQATAAKHIADTSPAWSPDSKVLAFVSDRSGTSQIWAISLEGGEAVQVTSFPVDVDNIRWSPSGDRIAFTAEVYPDCPDLACTAKRDEERSAGPIKAMIFDRLMIRHWDSWLTGKRQHIFTLRLKPGPLPAPDGDPVDLLEGLDHDAPTRPFGGREEYAWSPDGREIAFTSKMAAKPAWSTDTDVYLVSAEGGSLTCITEANEAADTQPVYSPDGASIAYLAMKRPGYEADRLRAVLYDRRTKSARTVADDWDRSIGSLAFTADGKGLVAVAEDTSRQPIFLVEIATGRTKKIVPDHNNGSVSVVEAAPGPGAGRIVFAQDSLTSPVEIFTARVDGSDVNRLTHVNDERLAAARMSQPEEFWFKGANGEKVHGWIMKPVDFKDGTKYPLAYLIHGGPQNSFGDHFHYRWNPQAYTGAGYAAAGIDFHGSTGYGQDFTDSIHGDWGGKPYEDLMKGIDHILSAYPWVDGERMCALGASFGGYMVNWIGGNTDRFKCLVSHDGSFNEVSAYYTTEELWFPEWDLMGTPWENPEMYAKWSPDRYVQNWKTPTLVIHGAKDFRVVDTEGISVFTALQRLGVPSKLLYFPDENHWVLKAKNSILWHETVIGWLDQWLGPKK